MAQRIHGIDLGSHLVKVAVMEVGFRQTVLERVISVPVEDFASSELPPSAALGPDLSSPQGSGATSGAPGSNGANGESGANGEEEAKLDRMAEPFRGCGAVLAALREALGRARERADVTVLGLPGDMASFRVMEFPFHDARKVSAVIGYELEGQIPYELDEVVFSHQLSAGPSGGGRALVAVAPIARTERLLELLRQVGVDPHTLTVAPLGYGYLGVSEGMDEAPWAVLDIGHERTNLAVLRGTSTVLARTLSRGGAQITRALAALYEVSEERAAEIKHTYAQVGFPGAPAIPNDQVPVRQAVESELVPLVRAVRQSLLGIKQREDLYPKRIVLCGGGSAIRGLAEWLTAELEVPVDVALPPGGPTGVGARGQVLAVGLAQTAADRRLPALNLRLGRLARSEDRSIFRRRALYFAWSAVVIFGLLILNGFLSLWSLQKEEQYLRRSLAHQTLAIFSRAIPSEEEVTRRINAALKGRKASSIPIPEASAFALLSEISRQLPAKTDVTLDVTRLYIREGKIDFEGTVKDAKEVDKVVESLKKIKCFTSVTQGRVSEVSVREMVEGEVKTDKRRKFTVDIAHECI